MTRENAREFIQNAPSNLSGPTRIGRFEADNIEGGASNYSLHNSARPRDSRERESEREWSWSLKTSVFRKYGGWPINEHDSIQIVC